MGYACPVCDAPQADDEHLANHLAFSAVLGHEDHEAWLDDHAPGWGDCDPPELADRVTEYAPEREYPQVFEDASDQGLPDGTFEEAVGRQAAFGHRGPGRGDPTAETERILAEAREMTRQMVDDAGEVDDGVPEGDEREADAPDDADAAGADRTDRE